MKALSNHISCEYKCKFDGIQINGRITINVDVIVKKHHIYEKDYIWNPATWSCKNGKYLASIINHSVITCDEIISSYNKETKAISKKFNKKKATCKKSKISIFYLQFFNYYGLIDNC